MSTVQQDFKRRLARAEITVSAVHPADLQAASHRQTLRMRATIYEFIRDRFLLMGLDPALAVSLRVGEEAAAKLAAIPDTEALRTADKALTHSDLDDDGAACSTYSASRRAEDNAKIERMIAMYREGVQPNFANDSVMQLYAYCIAMAEIAMAEIAMAEVGSG
jgi:hypothetical protein